MQKLLSSIRSACQQYNMIEEGDKIAIGVSAGKDSLALLAAMAKLRSFYPVNFEIIAITVDMRFENKNGDFSEIKALCDKLNVEYFIKEIDLAELIFNVRKEKNPCSLCSKMRRGILISTAKELGCNKIALGHHLDDLSETFMMNLLKGARFDCFMPVTEFPDNNIAVIRPMIFARESDCARVARNENLPVKKSLCPADKNTDREEMKEFIKSLEKDYGNVRFKILEAMQNAHINGY